MTGTFDWYVRIAVLARWHPTYNAGDLTHLIMVERLSSPHAQG